MSDWSIPSMNAELSIDPPEDDIIGYDWNNMELYGYEEGFVIDGEFVPVDDAVEYLTDRYSVTNAKDFE